MRKVPSLSAFLPLLFLIISACFVTFFTPDSASAQQCFVEVCKSAPGAGDQGFLIDFFDSGQTDTVELFDGGDCFTTSLNFDADVVITEQPIPGWTLDDIGCVSNPGFDFEFVPGGVIVLCTTQSEASTTCTFFNSQSAGTNIPTLSEWGMIAAAGGLMLAGVWFAVRRKRTSFNS
jgi:hypothetical protein